jgi:GNAT superfamily N-acetyltransferase
VPQNSAVGREMIAVVVNRMTGLNATRHYEATSMLYQLEPQLTADEFIDILRRSTLAARRPVDDRETILGMLAQADIILTARHEGQLVGVSRAITDFHYCTYLSDLAVDQAFQRQGIGQELLQRTHVAAGLCTTLILLAAPQAASYYPHIGMQPHGSCWIIPRR